MNSWVAWIWIAALLAVFYFLLIRPQQKRAKEHQRLVSEAKVGDDIVTIGGIYGKIRSISEDSITIEVDKGVRMKITKNAISKTLIKDQEKEKKPESESADTKSD